MIIKHLQLQYWLALIRAPGIGANIGYRLLEKFSNIEELFNSSPQILAKIGLSERVINGINKLDWDLIEQDLRWLEQPNHHLITIQDPEYPPLLKQIAAPPLALFVNGNPQLLATPQLAIVGSRNPSHFGMDNAYEFAKYLAGIGITITSGFAMGIDTESHKGSIDGGGKTIAVMGAGCNSIYPARNKPLAEKILESRGALISEFPIGTPIKPENFPRRNRIISGLSLGTLVVEATIRSGSLITARLATEQGREVFAIPGSIHNPLARGCHQLIRSGAKLVETAQDVLEELGPITGAFANLSHKIFGNGQPAKTAAEKNQLDYDYQKLLDCIGFEAVSIDILIAQSGFKANEVASMLLILELQGYIKNTANGYIKLTIGK